MRKINKKKRKKIDKVPPLPYSFAYGQNLPSYPNDVPSWYYAGANKCLN